MLEYLKRNLYTCYILNGSAPTHFAGVKNPNKAAAAEILRVIHEVLLRLKSSDTLNDEEYLDRFYTKLVNCNFDGASVMSGSVSEVQTRMKERQNGFIYANCTDHQVKLELEIQSNLIII